MIGGGFSGLTIAYYLNKIGYQVNVLEKEERWGGWLKSEKSSFGLIESAANGILETKLSRELFLDLDLSWISAQKKSERHYIFRNKALCRWPLNLKESLRFSFGLILFCFFRFCFQPRKYETLFDWGKRIFGKGATLWLIGAFLQGIYASNPHHLSARLVLRRFFKKKKKGEIFSKPKKPRLISPANGMENLIQSLKEQLKKRGVILTSGIHLQCLNESSSSTPFSKKNGDPLSLSFEHPMVFATGLKQAQPWLLREASKEMQECFQKIKTLSLVSVTLFYHSPSPFLGFGVLFPDSSIQALGVLNNGDIFKGRVRGDGHSETWIFGGRKEKTETLNKKDKDWLNVVAQERLKVFRSSSEPVDFRVSRSFDVFPSYDLELEKFLCFFEKSHPSTSFLFSLNQNEKDQFFNQEKWKTKKKNSIYFTGNYLGALGLSQILEYNRNLSYFISVQS